jgi:hypothetical protein
VTCYRRQQERAWTEALIEDIENELDASSPTKAPLPWPAPPSALPVWEAAASRQPPSTRVRSNFAYDAGGVAHGEHIRRDVSRDDGAGANGDARQDDRSGSDPHVVADLNRLHVLPFLSPSDRIDRVAGGQEFDIGAELAVCTD